MLRGLLDVLIKGPCAANEQINLRAWFAGFVGYMMALAVVVFLGIYLIQKGNIEWGTALWVIAGMMFYLSLCCTFCPLPTTWLILAVGSGGALSQLIGPESAEAMNSIIGGWSKVAVVAVLGGLATTMANLNEYHVFTFLLRYRHVSKVRHTRLYAWAGRWYNKEPFLLLTCFCFIPIPVDVVRWLAISHCYPRAKFLAANMLGRGTRYALMAIFSNAMGLGLWTILLIQAVLVLIAAKRVLTKMWKKKKETARTHHEGHEDHEGRWYNGKKDERNESERERTGT